MGITELRPQHFISVRLFVHVQCLTYQCSRYERTRCVDDSSSDPPGLGTEVQVFVRNQANPTRTTHPFGLWHDGVVSGSNATHLTIRLVSESSGRDPRAIGIQWLATVRIRPDSTGHGSSKRVWRLRTAIQPEEITDIALLLDEQGKWVESEAMCSSRFDGQYNYGSMQDPLVELMYSIVRPGGPALPATTLLSESRHGTFDHPKGNSAMRNTVKRIRYLTHI